MSNCFDAASDATFRARVEAERDWTREQVDLLWRSMSKRRGELAALETELSARIEAIRERINGATLWAAIAAGSLLFSIVKPKLGL
jgi:hypothetical protein